MGYPIDQKMVVCVTSSALFDMTESDKIFREEGVKAYKEYQESKRFECELLLLRVA